MSADRDLLPRYMRDRQPLTSEQLDRLRADVDRTRIDSDDWLAGTHTRSMVRRLLATIDTLASPPVSEAEARRRAALEAARPSVTRDENPAYVEGWDDAMDVAAQVAAPTLSATPSHGNSLDTAWTAAVEALPEGWSLWWLNRDKDEGWDATAGWDGAKNPAEAKVAYATGPTPTLALEALTARLASLDTEER